MLLELNVGVLRTCVYLSRMSSFKTEHVSLTCGKRVCVVCCENSIARVSNGLFSSLVPVAGISAALSIHASERDWLLDGLLISFPGHVHPNRSRSAGIHDCKILGWMCSMLPVLDVPIVQATRFRLNGKASAFRRLQQKKKQQARNFTLNIQLSCHYYW